MAVTRPLASTVTLGVCVAEPKLPAVTTFGKLTAPLDTLHPPAVGKFAIP